MKRFLSPQVNTYIAHDRQRKAGVPGVHDGSERAVVRDEVSSTALRRLTCQPRNQLLGSGERAGYKRGARTGAAQRVEDHPQLGLDDGRGVFERAAVVVGGELRCTNRAAAGCFAWKPAPPRGAGVAS